MKRYRLFGGVMPALALFAVCGCGSGFNASLGLNSNAEVKLISRDIRDLRPIVSPRQGAPTDADACTDAATGFGCDRVLQTDNTVLKFRTNETASTQPYYVYIQNLAGSVRTGTVQIRMDGDLKVNETVDVPANATVRVARVFRNSADTH